jgi:hypothetical protein
MKLALCGQDDCPRPYEFCEACVRADERERVLDQMDMYMTEQRKRYQANEDRAVSLALDILRAKTEALPSLQMRRPDDVYDWYVLRADVLALLDGGSE